MYFASRQQAGRMLAKELVPRFKDRKCVVIALSDGGVMIGAQIAMELHCAITMLLVDEIELPREIVAIGGITQDGSFTYNHAYSSGEIEELVMEYHGIIEQEKLEKLHQMHRLMKSGNLIRTDLIKNHSVILVSDGFSSGFSIDLALQYLKPIAIDKLVVATPLASVPAVDRMHVMADEIYCLDVLENYINTEHYYDTQDIPDHDLVMKTIEHIVEVSPVAEPETGDKGGYCR